MLSEWPSEAEAAALLGTSVKTISRYAAKGEIEVRKRQRPGRKPENVCNPADLERLQPAAHVMPAAPDATTQVSGAGVALAKLPAGSPALLPAPVVAQMIETIATAMGTIQTGAKDARIANEKLVLTLREASACGFSMAFLRRAVDSGALRSFRDGRSIKISRAALEQFVKEAAA